MNTASSAPRRTWVTPGVLLALIAGFSTTAMLASTAGLRLLTSTAATWIAPETTNAAIAESGLRAGIAGIGLFAAILGIPLAWRHTTQPRILRMWAFLGAMIPGWTAMLLVTEPYLAFWIASALFLFASIWWALWSTRWQGTGVAPSLLTGVLRPGVHPGQMWFAYVSGHQQGKIRPIMVLRAASPTSWECVYFTTQTPKTHLAAKYIAAPAGTLRGIDQDNYIEIVDSRELRRKHLRKYIGLAPAWLYERVCEQRAEKPEKNALTIEESLAGEGMGPFEIALHDAFHQRRHRRHHHENRYVWDVVHDFAKVSVRGKKARKRT